MVAQALGVGTHKVNAWVQSGELRAINLARKPPDGRPRYAIDVEDLKVFEQRRQVVPDIAAEASHARPAVTHGM